MTDGVTVEDGAVLDSPDAAKVFAAKRFLESIYSIDFVDIKAVKSFYYINDY